MANELSPENSRDRRRYTRFNFEGVCELTFDSREYTASLMDISLKGVLVICPEGFEQKISDMGQAAITINQGEFKVGMSVEVSHMSPVGIGLNCIHIDIDSVSHLKRLVELNLGVEEALQRELDNLIEDNG